MKNNYGLPKDELQRIFKRDKICVYCHKKMTDHGAHNKRSNWYTIEHLNYLPPWNNPATVTICCWSCNSSRGNKKIRDWFKTDFCITRDINEDTVAEPVRKYIEDIEDRED
ncbi:MAG: hypothetical protein KBC74_01670 [Candidatus Pacebacteria bacterium]|nr:hypothetical protein [Candidatus Paceibacterota bacterium]MBP9832219.1 hypothetical protein [Candidatus Paceibacterota bacterium]